MSDTPWRPSASVATLRQRAQLLAGIRRFFSERDVLEVETPSLCRYTVTDPHMPVIRADSPVAGDADYFLQTSPEYAMKRLLAAGSGPIFQLARAFRGAEISARHNPEFTLLEWYRPGFSLTQLMDEVETLVAQLLSLTEPARSISYRQLFIQHLDIDPLRIDAPAAEAVARRHLDVQMHSGNLDDWLNLLMARVIEPGLAAETMVFVFNYPASQAALAKVEQEPDGASVGRRFELYVNGIELANGYHELADPVEQRRRFAVDNQLLAEMGEPPREADEYLLAAMNVGMPDTSGVALGLDRLLMLALGKQTIAEVMAFASDRV